MKIISKIFLGLSALLFLGALVFVLQPEIISVSPDRATEILSDQEEGNILAEDSPEHDPVRLLFAGDIMLSRSVGNIMASKGDFSFPFRLIARFLSEADITFGNLESPMSLRGERVGSIYSFRADPRAVQGLQFAGFDVVSFANNHVWDYGREAAIDTMAILSGKNIAHAGSGQSYKEAHQTRVIEAKGLKIGFLAYTDLLPTRLGEPEASPAFALPSPSVIKDDIANAQSEADIIIVSFHWGEEYKTEHNALQENLAKIAIDAGADLIVGHHPHVVQELEQYNDAWIAYSLGNFVFDQNFSEETMRGALLEVVIKNKRIAEAHLVPVVLNDSFQPSLIDTRDRASASLDVD